MKPIAEYNTIDEWKEDVNTSGIRVHPLIYISISKIMEDKKLSFPDAYKYFYETGEFVNKHIITKRHE